MVWTFGTVSTAGGSSGTALNSVSRPSSISVGDWQVLALRLEALGKTPAFSNGTWTRIRPDDVGTDFTGFLYVSRYNGEGTTFNITWDGSNIWRTATVSRYTGGSSSSAADAADTDGTGFPDATLDTVIDLTGFTPVSDGDLIFYACNNFDGRTHGAPTGTTPTLTERSDFDAQAVGDGVQTTAAAIQNRTVAMAGGGSHNLGQLFAFTLGGAATTGPTARRRPYRFFRKAA